MALAYLLDPTNQHQNRAGVNNVHGFFKVYLSDTDDAAVTYSDFSGTVNPERIDIDNNGRAVIIADSSKVYRVEMYDQTGNLLYTQYPVWCLATGGGVTPVSVESTDGSIAVDKNTSGGSVQYDLSVNRQHDDAFLDWIRTEGFNIVGGFYRGLKSAGTMDEGDYGVSVTSGQYYHATLHVRALKPEEFGTLYGVATITVSLRNPDGVLTALATGTRQVDYSTGLAQDFEYSCDLVPQADGEIVVSISGSTEGSYQLSDMEIHRVYSGVPYLPGGVATRTWVGENYQKKLVEGAGIHIDPVTNEISADTVEQVQADWTEQDASAKSYIKHKPNLAQVATSGSYNDLSDTPSIPAAPVQSDWTENDSQALSYIKHKPNLATVATSGSYNDLSDKPDIPGSQVQSDWTENDSSSKAYILHKPNLASVATSGDYNDLSNKPSIPAAQVQSDWSQSNSQAVDYIKNKPNLASVATSGSYNDLSDKPTIPDAQVQSNWTENDSSSKSYIQNKPNLATVATSGSYNDLSDKPDIPGSQVQSDWTEADNTSKAYILHKPNLATVATSGSYNDLSDKPTIPTIPQMKNLVEGTNVHITETANGIEISADGGTQVQADWTEADSSSKAYILHKPNLSTVATSGSYNDLSDKPSIPASPVQSNWNESDSSSLAYILNKPNLATVATSGSYNDLSDKPSIPASPVQSNWNESDNTSLAYIQNKPNLASVATSGSYNDLSDKPTIPEGVPSYSTNEDGKVLGVVANGGTASLEWVDGGDTQVQADWTEADSSAASYIKNKPNLATVATSGSYNDLSDKPTIPAAQVQSNWTESDNTSKAYILNKPNLAQVATSGSYNDLSDKPTIPASPVQSNWNESDSSSLAYILNKPNLASVATSGSYSDLSNTPTIPTVDQTYNASSTNAQSGVAVASAVSGKEDSFEVGDGLVMETIGGVRTLHVETPVDIVAGPGIAIDNPDGNTLRVSAGVAAETVLYESSSELGTTLSVNDYVDISESFAHFDMIRICYSLQANWGGKCTAEIYKVSGSQRIVLEQLWYREQSGYNNYWQTITFSKYDDTTLKLTLMDGSQRPLLNNAWGSTGLPLTIYKIVGIHRIASNA